MSVCVCVQFNSQNNHQRHYRNSQQSFTCLRFSDVILAWALYYIWLSISQWPGVPWDHCDYSVWATENCTVRTQAPDVNETLTAATKEFWQRYVLQQSKGIDELGSLRSELVLCLALAWIVVYLCVYNGIRTVGRVV